MAEQATRRTGRPKKAETAPAAVKEAPTPKVAKKRPTIKREEVVKQHKEFEIPRGGGVVYMLPQKGVTVLLPQRAIHLRG
jgi:hypothetical protein